MSEFSWTTPIDNVEAFTEAVRALKTYILAEGVDLSASSYSQNFNFSVVYKDPTNPTKAQRYTVTDGFGDIKRKYSNEDAFTCDITKKRQSSLYVEDFIKICEKCDVSQSGGLYKQVYNTVIGSKDENCFIYKKSNCLYIRAIENENVIRIIFDDSGDTDTASMSMLESGVGILRFNFKFIIEVAVENSLYYDDPSDCLYDTFAFVICHEICHYKFAHNSQNSLLSEYSSEKVGRHLEVNIVEDAFINDVLSKTFCEKPGGRNYLIGGFRRLTAWSGVVINPDLSETKLLQELTLLTDGNRDRSELESSGGSVENYKDLEPHNLTKRTHVSGDFSAIKGGQVVIELDLDPFLYTAAGFSSQMYGLGIIKFIDAISHGAKMCKENATISSGEVIKASSEYSQGYIEGYYNTLVKAGVLSKEEADKKKKIDLKKAGV